MEWRYHRTTRRKLVVSSEWCRRWFLCRWTGTFPLHLQTWLSQTKMLVCYLTSQVAFHWNSLQGIWCGTSLLFVRLSILSLATLLFKTRHLWQLIKLWTHSSPETLRTWRLCAELLKMSLERAGKRKAVRYTTRAQKMPRLSGFPTAISSVVLLFQSFLM